MPSIHLRKIIAQFAFIPAINQPLANDSTYWRNCVRSTVWSQIMGDRFQGRSNNLGVYIDTIIFSNLVSDMQNWMQKFLGYKQTQYIIARAHLF